MPEDVIAPIAITEDSVFDRLNEADDDSLDKSGKTADVKDDDVKLELEDSDDDGEAEEEKPEESDEETEESDKKIKLEDTEDEDLQYHDVPNRQKILKEFPELFKKFPGIERAIHREVEYTNIFPSIQEAKNANEQLGIFNRIQSDLFSGNIENLLTGIKSSDAKAFGKITGNLLETLNKVDQTAYFNTVNHVVKHAINAAFTQGKSMDNEDGEQLKIAAQLLNKFIYGTTDVKAPEVIKVDKAEEDPREKELSEREKKFNEQQLTIAVNDVSSRSNRVIKMAVEKYIDPKGLMSGYVKGNAIKDVINQVQREIATDSRFKAHLDRLWKASYTDNYSESSKTAIYNAIKSRAETILPGYIKNVRAAALKGDTSRRLAKPKSDDKEPETTRRVAQPNRSSNSNSSNNERPRKVGGVQDVMNFLGRGR